MSIVKDLFLISLFLIMLIKYLRLHRDFMQQKKYFIQTLSHDLRVSTIAQIRGLELLQKNNNLENFQQNILSEVSDSCKFTLDMISMLLNTYKFENNEPVLNYEYANLSEIISTSCNIMTKICSEKDITFIKPLQNFFLEIDKNYILKAINILLSTAIFYSKRNSSIKISCKKVGNYLQISIFYRGNLLTDEERKRMFLNNPKFSTVGHGIKMHLCKKIIDFHNGKICINKHDGDLNSFMFSLPLKTKDNKRLKSVSNSHQLCNV